MEVNIKELLNLVMSTFIVYNSCEINNEMLHNACLQGVIH